MITSREKINHRSWEQQESVDVILVNMPFSSLCTPSLSLGLLQAGLKKSNIQSRTIYANLEYVDFIGLKTYLSFPSTRPQDGLLEWLFSPGISSEKECNAAEMVKELFVRDKRMRKYPAKTLQDYILQLQSQSGSFVQKTVDKICKLSPAIVCCTSTFSQHSASLSLCKILKAKIPVTTILGGPNCEGIMGRTTHRNFPWIDYVVSGEADDFFPGFIHEILEKKVHSFPLPHGVLGTGNGGDKQKSETQPIARAVATSMNDLDLPDYDDYFNTLGALPELEKRITPGLLFEASRGCWWGEKKGCTFCGLNGQAKGFRAKSAEKVMFELESLSSRYNIDRFEATDNILGMDFFNSLLPELKKRKAPYKIFFETKSNLNENQVKLLREAGVTWIQPGIESLSTKVLQLMNKGCSAWQNILFLKSCLQYGVRASWNILYNFPGEKDVWYQDMVDLLPLLTHLQPPSVAIKVRYDRFSHYFENQKKYDLNLVPAAPFSLVYSLGQEDLKDLVYFFDDSNTLEQEQNPVMAMVLERQVITKLQKKIFRWLKEFHSESRPVLEYHQTGSIITIHDTRAGGVEKKYNLEKTEGQVFLFCMNGPKHSAVVAMAKAKNIPKIQQMIEGLMQKKILIDLDNRYLSIATTKPLYSFPNLDDFPGGSGPK